MVDVLLGVEAHGHLAEARRLSLQRVQNVDLEGVLSVIVPATLGQLCVVLGGVQNGIAHELAVVQDALALLVAPFIVPVHHGDLGGMGVGWVVGVPLKVPIVVGQFLFQLGVIAEQLVSVHLGQVEHVGGVLDVLFFQIPVEVEDLRVLDVQGLGLAVAAVCVEAPALYSLDVLVVVVYLLESHAPKLYGNDLAQQVGLLLVLLLRRDDVGAWMVVRGIAHKIHHRIEQPRRLRHYAFFKRHGVPFHAVAVITVPCVLLIAAAEPLLIELDGGVDRPLGGLEHLQLDSRLFDLLLADPFAACLSSGRRRRLGFCVFVFVHLKSPCLTSRYRYRGLCSHASLRTVMRGWITWVMHM